MTTRDKVIDEARAAFGDILDQAPLAPEWERATGQIVPLAPHGRRRSRLLVVVGTAAVLAGAVALIAATASLRGTQLAPGDVSDGATVLISEQTSPLEASQPPATTTPAETTSTTWWLEFDPDKAVAPEDRAEAIARLGAEIPLPPGVSLDSLALGGGVQDETGLAGTIAYNASCQWTGYWIEGFLAGDVDQQLEANAVMTEVPSWPELVATMDLGGGPNPLVAIADAASANDADTVITHYQINCAGTYPGLGAALQDWTAP